MDRELAVSASGGSRLSLRRDVKAGAAPWHADDPRCGPCRGEQIAVLGVANDAAHEQHSNRRLRRCLQSLSGRAGRQRACAHEPARTLPAKPMRSKAPRALQSPISSITLSTPEAFCRARFGSASYLDWASKFPETI